MVRVPFQRAYPHHRNKENIRDESCRDVTFPASENRLPLPAHVNHDHMSLAPTFNFSSQRNSAIVSRPFHSNFGCFRFGSHPVHPSVIER
jgi:hypothetical protein